MPLDHLLMIPRLYVAAHRLHRQRRSSLTRRAALAVLRTVACCDGCEHPS
jgi:hypothetical protein